MKETQFDENKLAVCGKDIHYEKRAGNANDKQHAPW